MKNIMEKRERNTAFSLLVERYSSALRVLIVLLLDDDIGECLEIYSM